MPLTLVVTVEGAVNTPPGAVLPDLPDDADAPPFASLAALRRRH